MLSNASVVYPTSLDTHHFRLLYLTESKDVTYPVHIRLEVYPLNDRPEYETVSYLWGGEDDDSTPVKPIYVGTFWDVILTTRNCSAVLRYLRPQTGCRVVWIDAVCINQANNIEKSAQISRMGDIYTGCERVVAYFGGDLIQSPPGRLFRPRVEFQDPKMIVKLRSAGTRWETKNYDESNTADPFITACAESVAMSQEQLLERRYLSRIWIVQELVLPKRVSIPLGGSDILCDRERAMRLIWRTKDQKLDTPNITSSLSNLLKATGHCLSSDPRDKVYGLLGLFRPQLETHALASEYSLSWRDCWLGTGAYMLLVEKNLVLLTYAVCDNCPLRLPSWIPDIPNAGSWFEGLATSNTGRGIRASGNGAGTEKVENIPSKHWATEYVMYSPKHSQSSLKEYQPSEQGTSRLFHEENLCSTNLGQASVDSFNGALRLQVLRVFDRPCRLNIETEEDGSTSIWIRGPSTAAYFRLVGLKESLALNKDYEVFIISNGSPDPGSDFRYNQNEVVLLALTTALSAENSSVVTLHDCCTVLNIHFFSMDHLEASTTSKCLHNLYSVLEILGPAHIKHLATNFSPADDGGELHWIFACMFPSPYTRARDISPLLIRLTELERPLEVSAELAELISATAERICPDSDAMVHDNHLQLVIKNKEMWYAWGLRGLELWLSRHERVNSSLLEVDFSHPFVQDQAKWKRFPNTRKFERSRVWRESWPGLHLPFTVRIPLHFLLSRIQESRLYEEMCNAREFSKLLNEDIEALVARGPVPQDRHVFMEGWTQGLVKELGLVWKSETITIM